VATILLIDDEQAIRQLVGSILRSAGHDVVTASNGLEGIALYRSSPDRFKLVLTDLQMPTMNGHQFVKLARETSACVKIICMSGFTSEPVPADTEFLQKPFSATALRVCVDKLLAQK
jgi:two-component system, cell cycle sensor histidine kinase and response regulator CckA